MKILKGNVLANEIAEMLKKEIASFEEAPKLTIIQVGDIPASSKYVDFKLKRAWEMGIEAKALKIEDGISQDHLESIIAEEAENVDGIIIQLPLPQYLDKHAILDVVPVDKDIDGLAANSKFTPATPRGIMSLLEYWEVPLSKKRVSVIGRSSLVGGPVAKLLRDFGAIVKVHHKETGLAGTEFADVIISATGAGGLIKSENIKPGVVIIDVGVTQLPNGKIVGDVDRLSVGEKPSAMSPVIGGVGPMTIISLLQNLVDAKNKK